MSDEDQLKLASVPTDDVGNKLEHKHGVTETAELLDVAVKPNQEPHEEESSSTAEVRELPCIDSDNRKDNGNSKLEIDGGVQEHYKQELDIAKMAFQEGPQSYYLPKLEARPMEQEWQSCQLQGEESEPADVDDHKEKQRPSLQAEVAIIDPWMGEQVSTNVETSAEQEPRSYQVQSGESKPADDKKIANGLDEQKELFDELKPYVVDHEVSAANPESLTEKQASITAMETKEQAHLQRPEIPLDEQKHLQIEESYPYGEEKLAKAIKGEDECEELKTTVLEDKAHAGTIESSIKF